MVSEEEGSGPASDQPRHDEIGGEAPCRPDSRPELVIGLVGPVGTNLHRLAINLEERLGAFRYRCATIKVSDRIRDKCEPDLLEAIEAATGGERIRLLMDAGDQMREDAGSGDALMPSILAAIRAARAQFNLERGIREEDVHAEDACYIIDSLKHPDEITVLRRIYKNGFVLISAFDSVDARTAKLQRDIGRSNTSTEVARYKEEAERLIEVDSKRPGGGIGQNVRDSFPLGNFFLRADDAYDEALTRFLDLLFGNPYLTPYRCEQFMAEASLSALRSADLSRQIGAVIVGPQGEVLSSGCNDVPTAGGGTHWADDKVRSDNRDFRTGQDFNSVKKFDIINEMLRFLEDSGLYKKTGAGEPEEVTRELVTGRFHRPFKELRISNLIEFGRVVHAEMAALMRAAQRGIAVDGSTIYSTTFPCHMCARHIIAAGISRVVYVEPYPKSMTSELYPESVVIDGKSFPSNGSSPRKGDTAPEVVRFDPYEGVAPRLHASLFRAPERRKDGQGYTVAWERASARPKTFALPESELAMERGIATGFDAMPKVSLRALRPKNGKVENADQLRADT